MSATVSATASTTPSLTSTSTPTSTAPTTEPVTGTARSLAKAPWVWSGAVAGVGGVVAMLVLNMPFPTEQQAAGGVETVYDALDGQKAVQIGASLGFVVAWALALFSVGFIGHLRRVLPQDSVLPALVRVALTASVGAMFIGFGARAAAAGGMPGGIDHGFYTHADTVVISTLAGQLQWVGWQGVCLAMAATAVAAFRHRAMPKWVGAIGALLTLAVAGMTLVLCLPYSAGIAGPVFLTALSVGLLITRKYRA
ncbi:MAG TPA: hypothetical protein VFS29_09120 [Motilibacteraceae bacterium]|nr:hypothetical protein [Motilibacteraceae bacterium]